MSKLGPRSVNNWFFGVSDQDNLSISARSRNLRSNLLITMLFIAMVPLTATAGISYFQYRGLLQTETLNHARWSAENAQLAIEAFLDKLQAAIRVAADAYSVAELSDQKIINQVFSNLKVEHKGLVDLSFIAPNGVQKSYAGPYNLKGKDYSESPWYGRALVSRIFISEVFLGYRNVPHFVIAATKRDGEDNEYWVLRASVDTQTLNRFMESVSTEAVDDIFLINEKGILQSSSRFYGQANEMIPFEVRPKKSGITLAVNQQSNQPFIRTAGYVKGTPWILVQEQQGYFQRKSWESFRYHLLVTFFVCMLLVGFLAYRIADYISISIRKSDECRELMQQENEHTNKLASIGRLAAGVAHEINNPLAIISEKAGLMKDLLEHVEDFKYKDKFRSQLVSLEKAVSRSRVITHRLLGFARRMEVSLEPLQLVEVIEEVLGFLDKEAGYRNIKIEKFLQPDLPLIYSDHGQLQQVFLNIINNAIDAVDNGGEISIACQETGMGAIQVDISDNGPGIAPEVINNIFEPFFTTKRSKNKQGTGLGLSITYGLVKKLGGDITVHSELGTGTTFSIRLPKAKNNNHEVANG